MKKKKGSLKNPFPNHTMEEIAYAEATSYVIQVGVDFMESKGHLTFSKSNAQNIYEKLLEALQQTVKDPKASEEDRDTALKCIESIKVIPLRIQ